MVKLLELYKGTGSFGKQAKKRGWTVMSLDNEEKYNPDILSDIMDFKYKELDFTPDIITASPVCSSFSNLALTTATKFKAAPGYYPKVRNTNTMAPLAPSAVLGDKLLKRTIEIINYFRNKNPKLKFVMENPRGSMWKSPLMVKLKPYETATTYYCLYGDDRQKRTDFFNNFNLQLREGYCGAAKNWSKQKLCDRYKIPQSLLSSIFKQIEENKIKS